MTLEEPIKPGASVYQKMFWEAQWVTSVEK